MKYIDKISEKEKCWMILTKLTSAIRENPEMRKKWRTDVIGIARQYGGKKIPREVFEEVMDMKLGDIINIILEKDE